MPPFWLVALVVAFIVYGVICYLFGRYRAEVSEWRAAARRTPKPAPGREQFLADLRGEPARRDRRWFARWRADRRARQRRPGGAGNRRRNQ